MPLWLPAWTSTTCSEGISHLSRIFTPWVGSRPANSPSLLRSSAATRCSTPAAALAAPPAISPTVRLPGHDRRSHRGILQDTSRWLNQLVGLDGSISVHHGDVTDLPFPPASFTVVMSQHVQMNVADKTRLYEEARRVLRPRGRLAIWDITAGAPGQLDFPLPWADQPALSHLASGDQLRATIESAGLAVTHWSDKTEEAVAIMEIFLGAPPGPLGLHIFVDNFVEKANNLVRGLSNGRLRAVQAVAEARS